MIRRATAGCPPLTTIMTSAGTNHTLACVSGRQTRNRQSLGVFIEPRSPAKIRPRRGKALKTGRLEGQLRATVSCRVFVAMKLGGIEFSSDCTSVGAYAGGA